MSGAEIIAACGMALIIIGVLFFLARDMRRRIRKFDRFLKSLERRTPYVSWFSPGCILMGILLVFLGVVLAFL
jgi:formate-dependent nitrite reductase membrane component NrfD